MSNTTKYVRCELTRDDEVSDIRIYQTTYKCRLCGATFVVGCGGDEAVKKDYMQLCFDIPSGDPLASTKLRPHHCDDGNIGIADIIGYLKEKYDD
jgi:hypothetical protein